MDILNTARYRKEGYNTIRLIKKAKMHNARYRHTWIQEFSSGGVQAQLTERQMAE